MKPKDTNIGVGSSAWLGGIDNPEFRIKMRNQQNAKACVNCIHAKHKYGRRKSWFECNMRTYQSGNDVITGAPKFRGTDCTWMRKDGKPCGVDANLFEPNKADITTCSQKE